MNEKEQRKVKENKPEIKENGKKLAEICKSYGMGQTALARRFGIPIRTVQDWFSGKGNPPAYVVTMIADLLAYDHKEN